MRLNNYVTEKLKSYEYDEALNNPNIIIGAEFEFKFKENLMEYDYNDNEDYIRDFNQYEYYCSDFDEYENKRDEWKIQVKEWENQVKEWEKRKKWSEKEPALPGFEKYKKQEKMPEKPEEPEEPEKPELPYYVHNNRSMYLNSDGSIDPPHPGNYERPTHVVDVFYDIVRGTMWNNIMDNIWKVETDESLSGGNGIEVISPPMPLEKFLKICPEIFDFIDTYGYTDNDCGFHINISLKNVSRLEKTLDVLKLILFFEEDMVYKYFDIRRHSTYALSSKKK